MKKFDGHINIGSKITVYGDNAMHYAVNIWTKRFGYICFRPTTGRGAWSWYLYFSPNGTPWAATFAIGKGCSRNDRKLAPIRKAVLGHNFDTDKEYETLRKINNSLLYWLKQPYKEGSDDG